MKVKHSAENISVADFIATCSGGCVSCVSLCVNMYGELWCFALLYYLPLLGIF